MLRHALALLLGAAVALASVVVHRMPLAGLPAGFVLAAASSVAAAWWFRTSSRPRTALSFAGGWLLMFSLVLMPRPEGDYAVASDWRGYGVMVLGLTVAAVGLSSLAERRHEPVRA